MGWEDSGRYRNYISSQPVLQEIEYQMVDNRFPLSTEQFQEEIEKSPMVKGKTKLVVKHRVRYILINVDAYMSTNEIFNLGKRISVIEQAIILKSKILCNNTIFKGDISKQVKTEITDNQLAIQVVTNIEKIIDNNNFATKHNESLTAAELSLKINQTIINFKKETEKFINKVKRTPLPKYGK